MLQPIREHPKRQCLRPGLRLLYRIAVDEHAGQLVDLGNPSPVFFPFNLDFEFHGHQDTAVACASLTPCRSAAARFSPSPGAAQLGASPRSWTRHFVRRPRWATNHFELTLILSTLQVVDDPIEIMVKLARVCCARPTYLLDDWITHWVHSSKSSSGVQSTGGS
jgi:hypothetical protein